MGFYFQCLLSVSLNLPKNNSPFSLLSSQRSPCYRTATRATPQNNKMGNWDCLVMQLFKATQLFLYTIRQFVVEDEPGGWKGFIGLCPLLMPLGAVSEPQHPEIHLLTQVQALAQCLGLFLSLSALQTLLNTQAKVFITKGAVDIPMQEASQTYSTTNLNQRKNHTRSQHHHCYNKQFLCDALYKTYSQLIIVCLWAASATLSHGKQTLSYISNMKSNKTTSS